ncbi:purine-nucleoside phosphorylase [Candidatus Woesearchaeota archaeon]|nr:purine-nucleoside phosphorylase [Candidatus Woesearchaeota archaeon]
MTLISEIQKAVAYEQAVGKLAEGIACQQYYEQRVTAAADYVRKYLKKQPEFGVVLGSGLGDLANELSKPIVLDYGHIPYFPTPTVAGHLGRLLIGSLEGVPVIALQGRKHYYEVADQPMNTGMLQVVFPVHVLASLGVPHYFVTNAAGGLNPTYHVGDLMAIKTHINLLPNPLLGRQMFLPRLDGQDPWRFQPMSGAYDPELTSMLRQAGIQHEGAYLAVTGPTYETEGESIAFRDGLKADAVGMSTTPEVIVARNRGMKAVGFSCITNKIAADGTNATNHEEVTAILESPATRERLSSTVREFFHQYKKR